MMQSLVISVRFHDGRYHGQEDGFDEHRGWPPSPGRLFQALVAGAAKGAVIPVQDQRALRWLEALAPPSIAAPPARQGRSVPNFVPNNDLDTKGGDPSQLADIRVGKQWRPHFFDAEQPILYLWDFDLPSADAQRVCDIAARLYQLGRGLDMAAATGEVMSSTEGQALLAAHPGSFRRPAGRGAVPVAQRGSLDSLIERRQRAHRRLRFDREEGTTLFSQPPKALLRHIGYNFPPQRLYFELRKDTGFAPVPLRSAAALMSTLRTAATQKLRNALPNQAAEIERLLLGRGATPGDIAQRVRMSPIPSIGMEHTDPSVRRILVEVPVECPIRRRDIGWAFAGLNPVNTETGEALPGRLVSATDATMFKRYMRPARLFRSVTAVALARTGQHSSRDLPRDGHKTARHRCLREKQAEAAVVQALRHAGVGVMPSSIRVQREPLHRRGNRAEDFAAGTRFSPLAMWHLVLRFPDAVDGPLVIGDGRFFGLGLMEPVTADYSEVLCVDIGPGRSVHRSDGPALVHALRRALMSLARDERGRVDRLFSGHEADGRPDTSHQHAHVYIAADQDERGRVRRLIVAAPWAVNRAVRPGPRDRRRFDEVVHRLAYLHAGKLGNFRLRAVPLDDADPVLGPAEVWESRTPYLATRDLKKKDDSRAVLTRDLMTECHRRSLPAPSHIDIRNLSVGPRGGRPTAELVLRFATAVRGPVLLGRDSHKGGGLFHAVPHNG